MEIHIREHIIKINIITLTGRLEAFTVAALRNEVDARLAQDNRYFVVDLSGVSFMDSAGMAALVSLLKRSRQIGGDVVLVKPVDPAAMRILTLTRFDQVFTLCQTVAEALKHF